MGRKGSGATVSVEEVRRRFEQWRQNRRGKARIPDELWSAAVAVARREGVNRTAAALHLDGGKLKRRMVAAGVSAHRAVPPAFVELVAPSSGPLECTIELEGRQGKIRIHCKGASTADLVRSKNSNRRPRRENTAATAADRRKKDVHERGIALELWGVRRAGHS